MEVILAEYLGFCYGVKRAIQLARSSAESGPVSTLGPIIHNPQIVERFRARGVNIIETLEQAQAGSVVVIRSHGVSSAVYDRLLARGVEIADATCPFVAKIHRIVSEATGSGRIVLIAGDETHPEVEGICGHCKEIPGEEKSFYVFLN